METRQFRCDVCGASVTSAQVYGLGGWDRPANWWESQFQARVGSGTVSVYLLLCPTCNDLVSLALHAGAVDLSVDSGQFVQEAVVHQIRHARAVGEALRAGAADAPKGGEA